MTSPSGPVGDDLGDADLVVGAPAAAASSSSATTLDSSSSHCQAEVADPFRHRVIVCRIMAARRFDERDDGPHPDAGAEEWVFTAWLADGSVGLVSGLPAAPAATAAGPGGTGRRSARRGQPLLHVTEWDVPARPDPLLVKAHGLWAEHVCDAPMEQWTVANETYAAALDDPDEALGRAYGMPSAVAFDLEWYAAGPPVALPAGDGYEQDGVVHGIVELPGGRAAPDRGAGPPLAPLGAARSAPLVVPDAFAHTGLRAPFAFPDGTVADWVLTPDGWRSRAPASAR